MIDFYFSWFINVQVLDDVDSKEKFLNNLNHYNGQVYPKIHENMTLDNRVTAEGKQKEELKYKSQITKRLWNYNINLESE